MTTRSSRRVPHRSRRRGGKLVGQGMKGSVYTWDPAPGDREPSFTTMQFGDVIGVDVYLLEDGAIVLEKRGPEFLEALRPPGKNKKKKNKKYVVKEFTVPDILHRTFGSGGKAYMLMEIEGFRNILPLLKPHKVVGMPLGDGGGTMLLGFEIFLRGSSRCFVVNAACETTMSPKIVDAFTEAEFQQFVGDILATLVELQTKLPKPIAHGDIKLDNIMLCNGRYELIDWENSRPLDYQLIVDKQYLGLSPMYYRMRFGEHGWYPAFHLALPNYLKETGGYDSSAPLGIRESRYAAGMVDYYNGLFAQDPDPRSVFEKVKLSLDLCAFGMILNGILANTKNPILRGSSAKYRDFVSGLYLRSDAKSALDAFQTLV